MSCTEEEWMNLAPLESRNLYLQLHNEIQAARDEAAKWHEVAKDFMDNAIAHAAAVQVLQSDVAQLRADLAKLRGEFDHHNTLGDWCPHTGV